MKSGITSQQFEALLVLRDELHFGRAAVRLGLAQPHLSALLRRVEEMAGFRIFERRPAVRLTPAGAVLLRVGSQMLADVAAGIAEAKMVASGAKGLVRIGYSPTAIFTGLAGAITKFADCNPLVELRLREASAAALYEQFSRGELDMLIVRADGSKQPATSIKLVQDKILALLPEHHPAPPGIPLSLKQLNHGRFIFFRRAAAPEYVDRIMTAAYNGGLRPISIQEVDSWSAALALVRSGFGFTLATAFYQSFEIAGARIAEIKEPLPDVGFRLVFDPERLTPSAEHFITQLKTSLQAFASACDN